MATWEIPSFDSSLLEPGKFYILLTNKDNATLLIEKPMSSSFVFTDGLHPDDFVIADEKIKLNPDVIRRYNFDPTQFIVGFDGMVHLKDVATPSHTEGVTINFSPVISNTQTVEDDDCHTPSSPVTPLTPQTVTINGKTIVRLTSDTTIDVVDVNYKIKGDGYLETGHIPILNGSAIQEHPNRITNTILKNIEFNAIKDAQGIAVEVTPPIGEVMQFTYTITTI